MSTLPKLIRVSAVANQFGVSPSTVRRWHRCGHLKAIQPGGPGSDWFVPRGELQRLLDGGGSAESIAMEICASSDDGSGAADQIDSGEKTASGVAAPKLSVDPVTCGNQSPPSSDAVSGEIAAVYH
jgi:predicted site-specific integrase-resolvase